MPLQLIAAHAKDAADAKQTKRAERRHPTQLSGQQRRTKRGGNFLPFATLAVLA